LNIEIVKEKFLDLSNRKYG